MTKPTRIHYATQRGCPLRAGDGNNATSDPSLVTCKTCLRRIGLLPQIGRPPRVDGRNKIQAVLSDRAFAVWEGIPRGERSKILSDFLESQS